MKQTLEQEAKEAALKEYPVCRIWKDDLGGGEEVDINESDRLAYEEGFIAGWKAKEKQDELTWWDTMTIASEADWLITLRKYYPFNTKGLYTEVLKRFKEYKEQKNKER